MKTDLASAIGAAIAGVLISYFICNIFIGPIEDVSVKTIDSSTINADLTTPDPEVFNYKALNPTVEVYVGDDTDEDIQQIDIIDDTDEEDSEENEKEEDKKDNK